MDNTNKNPIFSIKNFRSFGEDGADFELAPITVLTGCNSAGKSSLVKALMLLDGKSPEKYKYERSDSAFGKELKVSSRDLCLGNYKSVADKNIVMSYKVWSADMQDTLTVKREFRPKHNDVLNDGELYQLIVEKSDGTKIFQTEYSFPLMEKPCPNGLTQKEFDRFLWAGFYGWLMDRKPKPFKDSEVVEADDIKEAKLHEKLIEIVREKLKKASISEDEAAQFWKECNHTAWRTMIGSQELIWDGIVRYWYITRDYDENDLEQMKKIFIMYVVNDVCNPIFIQNVLYINSASAQISRLYTTDGDNKMSATLRHMTRKIYVVGQWAHIGPVGFTPMRFLNRWIKKFGIGDSIEIKGLDEGLGIMVYIVNGQQKRLLADEGYGITQLVSLLMQIDNCISCDSELFYTTGDGFKRRFIYVEEPEIHLHPKYQSLLAEMFVDAYHNYNIHFIIETHSEYLIRKLQVMVADKENALASNDVSLNYVEKNEDGVSHNRQIKIKEDGRLDGSFGEGFYDEAGGLSRQLFMLNN